MTFVLMKSPHSNVRFTNLVVIVISFQHASRHTRLSQIQFTQVNQLTVDKSQVLHLPQTQPPEKTVSLQTNTSVHKSVLLIKVFPGYKFYPLAQLSDNVPILTCGAISKRFVINFSFAIIFLNKRCCLKRVV